MWNAFRTKLNVWTLSDRRRSRVRCQFAVQCQLDVRNAINWCLYYHTKLFQPNLRQTIDNWQQNSEFCSQELRHRTKSRAINNWIHLLQAINLSVITDVWSMGSDGCDRSDYWRQVVREYDSDLQLSDKSFQLVVEIVERDSLNKCVFISADMNPFGNCLTNVLNERFDLKIIWIRIKISFNYLNTFP